MSEMHKCLPNRGLSGAKEPRARRPGSAADRLGFLALLRAGVVSQRGGFRPRVRSMFLSLVAPSVVPPSAVSFLSGRRFFFAAISVGSSSRRIHTAAPNQPRGNPPLFRFLGESAAGNPPFFSDFRGNPPRGNPPRGNSPGESAGGTRRGESAAGESAAFLIFGGIRRGGIRRRPTQGC